MQPDPASYTMPPTTRTATATRRRLRRRPSAPSTAASCCRGLLAAALVARVATGAPSPLPVDGVEQQPSSQTTKQPPGGGGGGGGGLGLGLRSQDAAAPYSFDTRARTLGILQTLRSGQHPLEVLDEALPGGQGEVGFSLEMRGWDGRPYVCTPVMDPRPSLNATMDGAFAYGAAYAAIDACVLIN